PRAGDRRPLSRDPPSQLPRPAAGPLRLGPGLPQRDRRPGLAPVAPAARRADELRGGPARVGVRRAVRRLSSAHLAAAAVPLLSRAGRVRRRVTSIPRATGRPPRPVPLSRGDGKHIRPRFSPWVALPAWPYFGTQRIRPRVAQALPKQVMGTRFLDGVAPGWERGVIGQEPSPFWAPTRNVPPRRSSARSFFSPARLSTYSACPVAYASLAAPLSWPQPPSLF